tara:strand:- start:26 stop:820 length:795 start_codon:yes stop_codon:yes gene_type:complete
MKIKVNHEVPFSLLEDSQYFNDYEFILPHLLDLNSYYRDYMLEAKANGRYIVMDNSLHELGEPYSEDRLMYWVEEIKPNEFVIPDHWEDSNLTIQEARKWSKVKLPAGVTKVVVAQGKKFTEIINCVEWFKNLGYGKIAFSYGASYYNDICPHPNKSIGKALGRLQAVSKLYKMEVIKPFDRVHLLGCAIPQEFSWYAGITCIESLDTSNPIMATLDNIRYSDAGLLDKPKANMNTHSNIERDKIDYELLDHNLEMFRKINILM